MELSDLHVFRTVVEAGGITRAAEKLNRVQSNVTTRIQQLEEQLGVALFIREGKRLHLSPAGKVMLDYAERLLDLAREARDSVHDIKPRGLLRFIAPESTASIRLPTPLSEYCRLYPEVTLELRTGNGVQVANEILTGTIDAGIAIEPIPDAPFEKLPIYERGAGDHRGRRASADPLGARRAVADHPGVRAGLSVAQAAGRVVCAAPATCPNARSRSPPTTPCSAAWSWAWAFRLSRAWCSTLFPNGIG